MPTGVFVLHSSTRNRPYFRSGKLPRNLRYKIIFNLKHFSHWNLFIPVMDRNWVISSQQVLKVKMIYHRILFFTFIRAKNFLRCCETSKLKEVVYLIGRFFMLHKLFMWSSKYNFESKTISSGSFLFSDVKSLFLILALTMSFPENNLWHLPLFFSI